MKTNVTGIIIAFVVVVISVFAINRINFIRDFVYGKKAA